VATRHILSTDFRTEFVPVIGGLAHERILLGSGTTSLQSLRCVAARGCLCPLSLSLSVHVR
jgi:transformation/transcription domain-associated protein